MGGLKRGATVRRTLERRRAPVRFTLTVAGRLLEVEGEAPEGTARLDELLPVLRALDNAVVAGAIAAVEANGERVSCAKGCAACCKRQPVPVTPPEAMALARLVDRLPEPRRSAVRAAFADAAGRLRTAGLAEVYLDRKEGLTREAVLDVVRRYMALRLACPFLVDDACGIYEDRPFVCRQYLVTSPAELCADPLDPAVRPVPMPVAMATATLEASEALLGTPQYTVPLVLALEYVARRRDELGRRYDARGALGRILQELGRPTP